MVSVCPGDLQGTLTQKPSWLHPGFLSSPRTPYNTQQTARALRGSRTFLGIPPLSHIPQVGSPRQCLMLTEGHCGSITMLYGKYYNWPLFINLPAAEALRALPENRPRLQHLFDVACLPRSHDPVKQCGSWDPVKQWAVSSGVRQTRTLSPELPLQYAYSTSLNFCTLSYKVGCTFSLWLCWYLSGP